MHINLPLQIMKTSHTGPMIVTDCFWKLLSEVGAHSDHLVQFSHSVVSDSL